MTLDDLAIGVRARNALEAAGVRDIDGLRRLGLGGLLRIPNIGNVTAVEIMAAVFEWNKSQPPPPPDAIERVAAALERIAYASEVIAAKP